MEGLLKKSDIALMRDGMLFSSLDDRQFDAVVASCRVMSLKKNEMLFAQNQPARHFFLVADGLVMLTRTAVDGNEKVIDIINPSQTFAEAVILSEYEAYPVNARAILPSRVVAIDADTYLGFLKRSSGLCLKVMARMGQRMHWLINEVGRMALHNATYRLVAYLLDQIGEEDENKKAIQLIAPKQVIASRLTITPETLSRTLKKLSDLGLIDYRRNGAITLKNIPEMKRLIASETENAGLCVSDYGALGKCPRL